MWFQGRCLWSFSSLINNYGANAEYLKAAEVGVDFLDSKCTDPSDDRMFFVVTKDGKPLRKRRYMYSESFYVISMAEYGVATNNREYIDKAEKRFDFMLKMYRDPSSDPFKITPKGYAETRSDRASAVPMVLLSCAQLLRRCNPAKAAYYSDVVKEVMGAIFNYHYKPEMRACLETVGPHGEFIDTPAGTYPS